MLASTLDVLLGSYLKLSSCDRTIMLWVSHVAVFKGATDSIHFWRSWSAAVHKSLANPNHSTLSRAGFFRMLVAIHDILLCGWQRQIGNTDHCLGRLCNHALLIGAKLGFLFTNHDISIFFLYFLAINAPDCCHIFYNYRTRSTISGAPVSFLVHEAAHGA